MKKSESIKELATALAKAQAEFKVAELDGLNPHFKSKFATLISVKAATKDALAKYGLSTSQLPSCDSTGKPTLETIIMHTSGEWISGETVLYLSKQDMQQFGASVTYGKRIFLAAALGVVADEDDDGNAAVTVPKEASKDTGPKQQEKQVVQQPKKPIAQNANTGLNCLACGDVIVHNPTSDEYYCRSYQKKEIKGHATKMKIGDLASYKEKFIAHTKKRVGVEPKGFGL